MSLRLLQVTVPDDVALDELLGDRMVLALWQDSRLEGARVVQLAVAAEETESIMDLLEERFGGEDVFRVALLQIEAVLPRQPEEETQEEASQENGQEPERISREELYADVTDRLEVSYVFIATAALSAVVAAVGLLN